MASSSFALARLRRFPNSELICRGIVSNANPPHAIISSLQEQNANLGSASISSTSASTLEALSPVRLVQLVRRRDFRLDHVSDVTGLLVALYLLDQSAHGRAQVNEN